MRKTLIGLAVVLSVAGFAGNANAVTFCLDNFCDTMECGVDNTDIVTCHWNWTCDGTDNEAMIGAKHGANLVVSGKLDALGRIETWDVDLPGHSVEVYIWDGIGNSTFLGSDTFSYNTCTLLTPQEDKPTLMSRLGR